MIGHSDNEPRKALPVVAKRKRRELPKPKRDGWHQDPTRRKTEVVELGEANEKTSLTRKQAAILRVILDPAHADKTNVQKAELAGVNEATLYRVLALPHVEAERQRMMKHLVVSSVAPALAACATTAAMPGRDGFQDRRLLLSMSGDYVERQRHEHQVDARVVVGVVGVSMDEL